MTTEKHELLKTIFKWFVGGGCEALEGDIRSGWPSTAWNWGMAATVLELVARDHWMAIKLMEDQVHITWKPSDSLWRFGERGRSAQSSFHTVLMDEHIYHDRLVLPGEFQYGGDRPLTLFTWPHTSWLLLFLEAKTERKQISGRWWHQAEHDHHIKDGSFGWLQCMVYAASRKV